MNKMSENRIKRLAHIGVGGQKGWIYSVNGCSPTLPATQYKAPTKILIDMAWRDKNENNSNRKFKERHANF